MKAVFFFIILPIFSFSQKITTEIDKFSNEKRIETGWASIKPTLSAPMSIKLRSVGKSIFITLAGANYGANVIGNDAIAIFLLDNKLIDTVYSTGIQDYEIGEYSKSYRHQYSISSDDLRDFSEHLIRSIRKYDSETYHDFDIEEKNAKKIQEFVIRFLKEYDSQ